MRPIDGDKVPKLFDKEYRETMKLIREGEDHLDNLAEGFSEAAKVIREMPTIEQYGTWIPCSERLPECEWGFETGALMFQLKDSGYIEVGFFGTGSMWRDKYFRTYNNLHGYDASSVIAWMPLPEPYGEN